MPENDTEAINLFNEAQLAIQESAPVAEDSAVSLPARAPQAIYERIACGDGWITYTGTVTDSTSGSGFDTTAHQTYVVDGVIDNATVFVNGESGTYYTINGTTSDKSKTSMKFAITDESFAIQFAMNIASGASISFKRSTDGKGGKFIVSYATNFKGSFDMSEINDKTDPDAYDDYFADTEVTMYVYDDTDTLVREVHTTLDKLTVTALNGNNGIGFE